MKCFTLLALAGVFTFTCSSHTAIGQMAGNEGVRLLEFRDADGTLFKSGNELGVRGTPMVDEGWGRGTIHFKNGLVFTDTAINLSLYNGRLYMNRNGRYVEFVQPAASISLSFKHEDGSEEIRRFHSGLPVFAEQSENTLYEVLYEGKHVELVAFLRKKVTDPNTYGGPTQKEYSLVRQLFLFQPEEQKIIPLKSYSADALRNSLPSYSNAISKFLVEKKSPKNKEQLIELLAYLEKG